MSDMLKDGLAWLNTKRKAHMGLAVHYRRGSLALSGVTATFGKTDLDVTDDNGAAVRSYVWDFLIDADDLGLTPQGGDEIVYDSRIYEVMPLGADGVWRWSGPHRTTYRIHTRDMGTT